MGGVSGSQETSGSGVETSDSSVTGERREVGSSSSVNVDTVGISSSEMAASSGVATSSQEEILDCDLDDDGEISEDLEEGETGDMNPDNLEAGGTTDEDENNVQEVEAAGARTRANSEKDIEIDQSIANAIEALIKAASEPVELVAQGKVQNRTRIASEDGQWSEGLVSAARLVAAATHNLCEAANSLVQGNSSEEKLIAAAKQVSAATAQLLVACKVKADPDSLTMKRLEAASNAVRRATDELVKAAQGAIERNEEEGLDLNTSAGTVNIIAEEVEARETVARMEKQLRDAQRRLEGVHKKKYNKSRGTDSETDQSG